jgi:Tfp pilus assembly protein PilV
MNIFSIKNKGFILIEAIIGVSILAFSLLGVISVGQAFLRLSFQSFQTTQASFLLEEGEEATRALRDESWNNIGNLTVGTKYYLNFSGGKWSTSTAISKIDNIYYRYVTISNVNRDNTTADIVNSGGTLDIGTKKITTTVTWNTSMGTSTKTAMVYLTNI